jgi:hypothetical protein
MEQKQIYQTIFCLLALILCFSWFAVDVADAQLYENKWLNIGSLHSYYNEAGNEPREDPRSGLEWPAQMVDPSHFTRKGMQVAITNWTDPDGRVWPVKISHVGPRSYGEGEVFPIEFKMVSKYDEPEIYVDDAETFLRPVYAGVIDEIDPALICDRLLYCKVNHLHGVTVERTIYAWSNEFHDNYHIHDYVLTNTGNVDGDDEIELPNQVITGLYWGLRSKHVINRLSRMFGYGTGNGRNAMRDIVGDGNKDYINDPQYGVDFRANYQWHGWVPTYSKFNTIGGPIWYDDQNYILPGDSVGRLAAPTFVGQVTLHASTSATDDTDDLNQPSTTMYLKGSLYQDNDAWDEASMAQEYTDLSSGHQNPYLFDELIPDAPEYNNDWKTRASSQNVGADKGQSDGLVPYKGYGPYTLQPGQSVRLVFAECLNGLDVVSCVDIGNAYKASGGDDNLKINYRGESWTKNEWVMTGRDSLFKTFSRARANWESGFNIPVAPKPPRQFFVYSGGDRIVMNWEPFENGIPSHSWEIWRGRYYYHGAPEDKFQYELLASLPPDARSYEDTSPIRGISYFYYIQAVGDVNNNPAGETPTGVRLKSNRSYTQTYQPAFLTRAPGEKMSDIRIVPNPYSLGSDKEVRWPDVENQLAFLDIPGRCTIKIFTERGDLVKEINHTNYSGDEYWNMQTLSNQMIVSGVYIAAITDLDTNETILKKFVVIR